MALSDCKPVREFDKFRESDSGGTCVAVCGDDGGPVLVTPVGISSSFLVTTVSIGDTESALPATALTDRKSVKIFNTSLVDTLYIGPTGVTADTVVGTTSGDEIAPGNNLAIDINDAVTIFAIAETGKTILVKISEYA